jgi:hypothetical protein
VILEMSRLKLSKRLGSIGMNEDVTSLQMGYKREIHFSKGRVLGLFTEVFLQTSEYFTQILILL